MVQEKNTQVAAIANQFIQHARYKLTPREMKLILHMASLIKPEDSDFETYLVPVKDIETVLKADGGKKHGSFYERLDDLLDSVTSKKITFPTDFVLEGTRLRGHINWVAGAVPKYSEEGVLCVEFGFSPQMKPFLLGLKERFTRFELIEVARMKSSFSIRIFQMCKAYYYENVRHGRNVMKVGVLELKERLGIKDKYPDFRNFRRKVLDVAKEEINEKTRLQVNLEFGRKGRKITQVHFEINEKAGQLLEMTAPEPVETKSTQKRSRAKSNGGFLSRIDTLTEAQRRAFNHLSEYGVNLAVVLDEILPIIKGSELDGYEDFFVTYMLAFFEKKTNRTTSKDKIKAFVQWIRNKRFEEPGLYSSLMEQVIARKKQLNDEERGNRERAKKMTAQEFRKLLASEKNIGKHPLGEPTYSVKNKLSANRRKSEVKEVKELFEEGQATKDDFNLSHFRKQHPKIYRKILQERVEALADLKESSNFDQLLQSSVTAYCEQWWKQQAG
ncbi:MAG: replication initiation protein [Saprospiraceae bacterium]|nr:replication initiation protein [Saprospiraceae bacterium]